MTVREIRDALSIYPGEAVFRVGVAIPDLFINTMANAAISGNALQSNECTEVRLIATVTSRRAHATEGSVPQS